MRVEEEVKIASHIKCDVCGVQLENRNVYRNDGSYQSDYVTLGKHDLCFTCAGKLFDITIKRDLSDEDIKFKIEDTRKTLRKGSPSMSVDLSEYGNVLKDWFN